MKPSHKQPMFEPQQAGKPRLLIVGDAVTPTGLGRSIFQLFQPLTASFEIFQLGTNFVGDPHHWPWPIYNAWRSRDRRGVRRLPSLAAELRPHLIFIMEDRWWASRYLQALQSSPSSRHLACRSVVLTPVDAGPIDPEEGLALSCDRLLSCTEYGRHQLLEARAPVASRVPWQEVDILPLGVDRETFYPLAEDRHEARKLARRQLFPDLPRRDAAFIVLNANRNQPRKRIDITLQGFAAFLEGLPVEAAARTYLHLHMGLKDKGWDLRTLGHQLGLDEHLIFTGGEGLMQSPESRLRLIHNAADVGINTSSAEGWGLVAFEGAACGVPQVVPGHTGIGELWRGHGVVLETSTRLWEPAGQTEVNLVDPQDLAGTLRQLHDDDERRLGLGQAAYRYATGPRFCWSEISQRLGSILDEMLGASGGALRAISEEAFGEGQQIAG